MHWQAFLFSAGSLVFIYSLIPMVRAHDKPPLKSSVPTGVVLLLYGANFMTIGGFSLTAATELVTAGLWLTLAVQRWRNRC